MQQTQLGHGQPEVLLLLPRLAWAEHTQICLQPQGSSQGLSSGHRVLLLKQVGCISMGVSTLVYPLAKEITNCSSSSAHRCPPP